MTFKKHNTLPRCLNGPGVITCWKHCRKRRKYCILFPQCFLADQRQKSHSFIYIWKVINRFQFQPPRPGGSVVSVSDSWPGGCEFDPRLRRLFFPAYFRLSSLQKHVRKVVGGFGKKSCVSTGVRKPGKHINVTDRHDMTLAVKVALNPHKPTINFSRVYFFTLQRVNHINYVTRHAKRNLMEIAKNINPVSLRNPHRLTTVETFRYWQTFCILSDNST